MGGYSSLYKTQDGFANVYRGLGGKRDTSQNTFFQRGRLMSLLWNELDNLYSQNWIAGKCVDCIVEDALKDDREIQCEDAQKLEEFENFLEGIDLKSKLASLMAWGKVFGSAVLVIVADDDEMDKPLQISRIPKGGLRNIAVLDRFDINAYNLDRNPLSPRYLKPEYYSLSRASGRIHHTRVIQFDGLTTTNKMREELGGFGLSIYERLIKQIANASKSPDLLINILEQSNIDVFKILGLNEALVSDQDSLVVKRLEAIMEGKSIFNGIALDKEDDYQNIAKQYSGLQDINKELYQVVSGAAGIPFSRFMGTQLNGLNPTGEGELKTYYDKIISERERLTKIFNTIDQVVMMHLFGEIIEYRWEFPSLFQMSPEQVSVIENRNAQTKQIYLTMGVINEFEAKASLAENPLFPTITAKALEEEKELYNELGENSEN